MTALPDYIIVGAMKCGTSTLAAQLGAQDGIFMTTPKEPNFFSNDDIYAQGLEWYSDLFAPAHPDDLCGEASTHYTKHPDYPDVIPRLQATGARPKLIYMIRNPFSRVVSHYIHEWTEGVINTDLPEALHSHSALISYSCYASQIAPWVATFGAENILILSLEDMQANPQDVLNRTGAFLGKTDLVWQEKLSRVNVSAERIRKFPLQETLISNPLATRLRRALIPQKLRDMIRRRRQMRERPTLSATDKHWLEPQFAADYAKLKALFPDRPDLDMSYPFVTP
ncbi:sulfotransferase domain-containing protein [Roseobacter litoralis]|uniref:sulfotransferase domain-containing protein n=1 Tax=Roseobacter litoralis TaxID=42443 RepID=UPI002490E0CF|nr:sulfotransferase domain-containing protein [Roseobacter litoralis]